MSGPFDAMPLVLGAPLGVGWAVGLAWLVLFAWRRRIGWSPLVAALVALHGWALGHFGVSVPGQGLTVSAGWLVLTGWPLVVLVAHVREGTHRARQLTVAVMIGIGAVTAVSAALSESAVEVLIRGCARALFAHLAALTAVVTWEILGRITMPAPLRLLGALLLALAGDATSQGVSEALLRGEPFEGHVLGALSMGVLACGMHGALGVLWLLVVEGERWVSPPSDRTVLQALGVMLGLQRHDPMRPHVVRDPESGLYHRSFLEDRAPGEFDRAANLAAPLSVLWVEARDDADRVGRAFLSCLRVTDMAARWGTDRYVAILPGADRTAARSKAVKAVLEFRGEASVGIALYPLDGVELERLVERAKRHARPVKRK